MRAGTQTLIQALQALPWTEVENDEDLLNAGGSSSDEDDHPGDRMSLNLQSSTHTRTHTCLPSTTSILDSYNSPSLGTLTPAKYICTYT